MARTVIDGPQVLINIPGVELKVAQLCAAQSPPITTDAQWAAAMAVIFAAARWPGVNAQSLAFVKNFFDQLVSFGGGPS